MGGGTLHISQHAFSIPCALYVSYAWAKDVVFVVALFFGDWLLEKRHRGLQNFLDHMRILSGIQFTGHFDDRDTIFDWI